MNVNEINEQLLSIRTYQAVQFEKKLDTFFSTEPTMNRPVGVNIAVIENVGVIISSEKDKVIVPYPNISGIYLKTEYKTAETKAFLDDISKPAKAKVVNTVKADPVGAKRL